MNKKYTSDDIQVLEGLEPVRARPGMYIGGTDVAGLHHLVWEAVDNSVDEAINGHCTDIGIVIKADGGIEVSDNGRGIPVDKHKKHNKPALELIMTTLHAGGKFDKSAYESSGGLHGVGISVVNALSEIVDVEIKRDGFTWSQQYSRGKPLGKLKKGSATKKSGTKISFIPDSQIFNNRNFNFKTICTRADSKAFINSGLRLTVQDERSEEAKEFHYKNGIRDYIRKLIGDKRALLPEPFYVDGRKPIRCEVVFQWTESSESKTESYCNSIHTADGGAHEAGVRNAVTKVVRSELERRVAKGKAVPITVEDVREGLTTIVSVMIPEPQFQGQTKDKLNNPEVAGQVEAILRPAFEKYMLENPTVAEAVLGRVELAAKARLASRAARDEVKRKGLISHRLTLPGKLSDCSSTSPSDSELFLVEGDSAGGSSKQARDRKTQAILPLRGKILNVENASDDKLLKNAEVNALLLSIGTGIGRQFDYSKLRYDKIIIMTDADVDGAHISALLLTFFYRHMLPLIEKGNIYLAMPPLYRIEIGKEVFYAQDDIEKEKILANYTNRKIEIFRFKGLGEMPAKVLKETTMDKSKRTMMRVKLEDVDGTETAFRNLMGKDASARFKFITENAKDFQPDV